MVFDQRPQPRGLLIVGRMGLKHEVGLAHNALAELSSLVPVVVDDLVVIELHARLHYQAHNPGPDTLKTLACKSAAMGLESYTHCRRTRDRQGSQVFRGAARYRNLGADDVHGCFTTHFTPDFLRDGAKIRGPRGHHRILQRRWITRARHRAIQVNLTEPRLDVGRYHLPGPLHRNRRRLRGPGVGTQVIAAQQESLQRKRDSLRDPRHVFAKVRGQHSRVAAELVHLVGSRLDQYRLPACLRLPQGRLDHNRVSGANGVDADAAPRLVLADYIEECFHSGCRDNRTAPISANTAAASL